MRVAHTADLHIGFRSGNRLTQGQNVRELDVAQAVRHAIDGMLTAHPALVVICGDIFDRVVPTPAAINFAFRQVSRLREAGIPVVMLAGNHESPRTTETGSILHLFREIGVDVATDQTTTFLYPLMDCRVVAVPWAALGEGIPEPVGPERYQVLAVHGAAEGLHYASEGQPVIPSSVLESEAWSYIACGDWHGHKRVGPRAYYSGSLEFCSSGIWSEADTPKSWILADLDTHTVEPHLVPTRTVLDLDPVDATDRTPAEVDAMLAERLSDVSGKLVRLQVLNIPAPVLRQLNRTQIKRWHTDALILKLDFLRPARVARESQGRSRQTLDEIIVNFLAGYSYTPGIDPGKVAALAHETFAEVAAADTDTSTKREVA